MSHLTRARSHARHATRTLAADTATTAADKAQKDAEVAAKVAAARQAERDRRRYTRDELVGATAVRTGTGWHRVIRLNTKTITIDGHVWPGQPYPLPLAQILDIRKEAGA